MFSTGKLHKITYEGGKAELPAIDYDPSGLPNNSVLESESMIKQTTFTLPFPPTLGRMWPTSKLGRRYLSQQGKSYRTEVGKIVRAEKVPHFSQSVSVAISLHPPCARRRDIDNFLKAVFDSLTAAGVWDDDSQVKRLYAEMCEKEPPGHCLITIMDAA